MGREGRGRGEGGEREGEEGGREEGRGRGEGEGRRREGGGRREEGESSEGSRRGRRGRREGSRQGRVEEGHTSFIIILECIRELIRIHLS